MVRHEQRPIRLCRIRSRPDRNRGAAIAQNPRAILEQAVLACEEHRSVAHPFAAPHRCAGRTSWSVGHQWPVRVKYMTRETWQAETFRELSRPTKTAGIASGKVSSSDLHTVRGFLHKRWIVSGTPKNKVFFADAEICRTETVTKARAPSQHALRSSGSPVRGTNDAPVRC